jgi:hypothetical protein
MTSSHPMKSPAFARLLAAAGLLVAVAGCRSVEPGPSLPPDPNAQNVVYGTEPKPASIPQKDVPAGESSLSHRKPDQRIDRP